MLRLEAVQRKGNAIFNGLDRRCMPCELSVRDGRLQQHVCTVWTNATESLPPNEFATQTAQIPAAAAAAQAHGIAAEMTT